MKKSLPIIAFYFINGINILPVPGTGWGLTAEAAALLERTGGTCGKTGWDSLWCPGSRRGYPFMIFWSW